MVKKFYLQLSRAMLSMKTSSKIFLIFLCGLLFLCEGCGTTGKTRIKKTTIIKKDGVFHTVKEGQTIYRIAVAYGADPDILLNVNGISDPTTIKAGQVIFIPGAKELLEVPATPSEEKKKAAEPSDKKFWAKRSGNAKNAVIRKGYFNWPMRGKISSGFGLRNGVPHDGVDIAEDKGTIIRAAAPGKVIFSDWGPTGYGNIVIIKHDDHLTTIYAHNHKNLVAKDKIVKQGEKIALLGETGRSTGPHLHFEVRYDREPVDPLNYLP